MLPGISYFFKRQGQIQKNHEIYKHIFSATINEKVKTTVEIGSWNGLGSTKAIREGLGINKGNTAIGIECKKPYFLLAKFSSLFSPRMKIKLGSLVQPKDLDATKLSDLEKLWIADDIATLNKLPNRLIGLHLIPFKQIDLLISDGGEFSGWAEFRLLESLLTKYVILDDVNTRKNEKVFSYLTQNDSWKLIAYSDKHNGTAFFEKIIH